MIPSETLICSQQTEGTLAHGESPSAEQRVKKIQAMKKKCGGERPERNASVPELPKVAANWPSIPEDLGEL
jgi:hypothetical protein